MWPCFLQGFHMCSTGTGEMTQCQLLGYICQCCCGKQETSRKVTQAFSALVFRCNEVIPSPVDTIWQWVYGRFLKLCESYWLISFPLVFLIKKGGYKVKNKHSWSYCTFILAHWSVFKCLPSLSFVRHVNLRGLHWWQILGIITTPAFWNWLFFPTPFHVHSINYFSVSSFFFFFCMGKKKNSCKAPLWKEIDKLYW